MILAYILSAEYDATDPLDFYAAPTKEEAVAKAKAAFEEGREQEVEWQEDQYGIHTILDGFYHYVHTTEV